MSGLIIDYVGDDGKTIGSKCLSCGGDIGTDKTVPHVCPNRIEN